MANQTPEQIAQAWANRLSQSTQKITDGVNAVKVAPGVLAARQADLWLQQIQANKAKWQKNTAGVTLGDWQTAMIEKGAPRIAQGANASVDKFASFMGQLLPHIDRVKASLPPRGTLDQNINRMVAAARGMAQFSYNK